MPCYALRRSRGGAVLRATETRVTAGALTVDAGRREAHLRGARADLTTMEFDLLWLLATSAGEIVSRQDIYRELFHCDYDGMGRSVDVCISRLRKKLGDDPSESHYIKTVWGTGYFLANDSR